MECPDTEHAHCPHPNCNMPLLDAEFQEHVENAHDLVEWVNAVTWAGLVVDAIRDVLEDHPDIEAEIDRRVAMMHAKVEAEQRRN